MLVLGPSLTDLWKALRPGGAPRAQVDPVHAKLLARATEQGRLHQTGGRADPAPYRALLAEHLNAGQARRPLTRSGQG